MSFTLSSGAYAGVHEDAVNDFITAFFQARPRYLKWGSPAFVSATSASATQIPAIPVFGIDYMVELRRPVIDIVPDTRGFPLAPTAGTFTMQVGVTLTVGCARKGGRDADDGAPIVSRTSTFLEVYVKGRVIRDGNDLLLQLDQVMLKDVQPESLAHVLECMMRMILQHILDDLRIPYTAVFIQIGTLVPDGGIVMEDDRAKAFATIV